MGIGNRKDVFAAGATKKTSEIELIFSEDDALRDLPESLQSCGWIPLTSFPSASSSVWRVTIRGFEPGEFVSFRQMIERLGRPVQHRIPPVAAKGAAHTCIKRVEWVDDNGKRQVIKRIKGNEQLDDWIDWLCLQGKRGAEGYAIDLLALVIEAVSLGRSVESCYADARAYFGVEAEEGDGTADASKSGS